MKRTEDSDHDCDVGFDTLICEEVDKHQPYQNRQQVSVSNMTPDRRGRLAAGILVLLAAVLLIVDVSLGVHYNILRDNHLTTQDVERIENELGEFQDIYKTAIKSMNDTNKRLENEWTKQIPTNWELDHMKKRKEGYEKQIATITEELESMRTHLPLLSAKARDPQLYYSADGLILAELNHFRNTSAIIRAKVEAQAALLKEQASHQQIKLQLKKLKTASDELQSQLETLDKENSALKSNQSIFVESCGRCLPKWLLIKSACYYYSYRYESDIKKSWQDSRADCISKGGDLLVINNLEEQIFINNNYPRVTSSSGFWWENGHWIGLTQVEGEEEWEWITNVTETETIVHVHIETSSMSVYKLVAVSLAVLAGILLITDIGLGVYYNKLTGGHIITDIHSEITKLQTLYNSAIQSRDKAKKELAQEINNQRQTEGCRHCLPGWTFLNSACYYIPLSETTVRRSWSGARQFCQNEGGDLAILDTVEKNVAVHNLIKSYHDPSRPMSQNGYWLGLRDAEEEGTWRWLNGRRLTEGYWNDGEPNDQSGNEDCTATYPRSNPFKAWNDAPCIFNLKWICEMAPRSAD
ncbi:hypothetical protein INR49_032566 [Caranx melampygus]|nr:hypothetical protein INR49_032566 [Caranx melampygus]